MGHVKPPGSNWKVELEKQVKDKGHDDEPDTSTDFHSTEGKSEQHQTIITFICLKLFLMKEFIT